MHRAGLSGGRVGDPSDTLIYRKGGQLDSLHLANGVGEKYGYDTVRGFLTTGSVFDRTGRQLMQRLDSFDDAGRGPWTAARSGTAAT